MTRLKQAWLALDWSSFEEGVVVGMALILAAVTIGFIAIILYAVPLLGAVMGFLVICGLIAVAKGKRAK